MYGAQTTITAIHKPIVFENDVEMYGAQTVFYTYDTNALFENDVEMYGAQTGMISAISPV